MAVFIQEWVLKYDINRKLCMYSWHLIRSDYIYIGFLQKYLIMCKIELTDKKYTIGRNSEVSCICAYLEWLHKFLIILMHSIYNPEYNTEDKNVMLCILQSKRGFHLKYTYCVHYLFQWTSPIFKSWIQIMAPFYTYSR